MGDRGSTDILDFADVGDLLDSLRAGEDEDLVAAIAAVTPPSENDMAFEHGASATKGESEEPELQGGAPDAQPKEEKQEHAEDKEKDEEAQGAKGGSRSPRPENIDVDATPLNMQQGYDRFKELEQLRAQQRVQMRKEEAEAEKAKTAYTGKKWAVKQQAGPLRPQEAGELAVACAVKAKGDKLSPREEIQLLTQREQDKKKREKALASASSPLTGPKTVPVKAPLRAVTAKALGAPAKPEIPLLKPPAVAEPSKDERPKEDVAPVATEASAEAAPEATGEAAGKHEAGTKDENASEVSPSKKRQSAPGSPARHSSPTRDKESVAPSQHEVGEAPGKGSKMRAKLVRMFTCISKKGKIKAPHTPPHKSSSSVGGHGADTGTSEEMLRVVRRDMLTLSDRVFAD